MALSAQDKILHVANKLGLSSLGQMQGSTGAVYDVDTDGSSTIFSNASRHQSPSVTNVNENQFEVNEALLVETISFYVYNPETFAVSNFQRTYGSSAVILFDLVIGNKRVMKDTPVFGAGSPYTFANVGTIDATIGEDVVTVVNPRHQVFMEGAGILIPPQVQWYVQYKVYNIITGATIDIIDTAFLGCYLYGTKVLLNFNTTI
jgi:hypothetical protein